MAMASGKYIHRFFSGYASTGVISMLSSFVPKRVYFEPQALEYPLGRRLKNLFTELGIEIRETTSHNRVTGIPGRTPQEAYMEGKRTLVVGVRRSRDFQTCKPSAHYQLPLVTSCPGKCEYCYLATNMGKKPYIRVYVNLDEILARAKKYMIERAPEVTVFEGAATSDPVPVEPYTHALRYAIEFFAQEKLGRFRFVTKFTEIDSLLDAEHKGKTEVRFSLNASTVIRKYEHGTPGMMERVEAAAKVAGAGYPVGFLIAPIMLFAGWQGEYRKLIEALAGQLSSIVDPKHLSFELITHRFTKRAKQQILDVFPGTDLEMDESKRKFKYGQFGYGKYIYSDEERAAARSYFKDLIHSYFPGAAIKYFV